jgi:tRNA(Arg) A34 adenosine deaminase TadA
MDPSAIELRLPAWAQARMDAAPVLASDAERMRFVVELAGENVRHRTGGPFGAAVFEIGTGALVSVGVNLVTSLRQSMLHAEVMAIMVAQQRAGMWTLGAPGMPRHELVTSCEPCAMCLGAVFWSGARRLVCGAAREDAEAVGFDEGPVYEASYEYLESRGIEVVRRVERAVAAAVLTKYAADDGVIYNG